MPGRLAHDDPDPEPGPGPHPDPLSPPGSSQFPPPLEDVPGHKMSVQEFEPLPPLSPEQDSGDDAELPTMWEDGGGLGVIGGGGGFSAGGGSMAEEDEDGGGGSGRGRALAAGQWAIVTEEAVRIFSEDVVVGNEGGFADAANRADPTGGVDDDGLSYEQRNNLIEQTLSEIYQSPFQQLNYVTPASSANSNHHAQQQLPHRSKETSSPHLHHRKKKSARFSDPDPESPEGSVSGRRNPANRTADNNADDDDGSGGEDCRESTNCTNGDDYRDENANEEGEDCSESEFSSSSPAESAGETLAAATADGTEAVASGGGGGSDADSSMKASIARAARLAVSGYRTCDDADSYVGTRVKPTLILARAPPSPCGILRRTNKKAAVKVGHGNVRWADGRVSSLSPPEDVIPE